MTDSPAPTQTSSASASRVPGKNVRGLRTKQRMLQAAAECFAEYGYSNTRISDIVHRAGVSQGNFYRHFESKAQALAESVDAALDDLYSASSTMRAGDPFDEAVMTARMQSYVTSYAKNRHLLRVMREAAAIPGDDGFLELWLHTRDRFVERTRRWLDGLVRDGVVQLSDTELIADILGAATEQTAYIHVGLPAAGPRPEEIQRLAAGLARVWIMTVRGGPPTSDGG